MKRLLLSLSVATLLAAPGLAAEPTLMKPGETITMPAAAMAMPTDHVMVAPAEIVWAAAPPALPPGAKVAVLKGDPSKETLFVMRVSLPAGYQIAPHWHPAFENVTVISGEANFGMGDTFDKTTGHRLPAGGFASMPPQTHHYFWTEQDTVLQFNAVGPWQLYYINPADDPRNMAKK